MSGSSNIVLQEILRKQKEKEMEANNKTLSLVNKRRVELLLGGVAAVGAAFFTNPLEVLKIRMQLQGELQAKGQFTVHYKNPFHSAWKIVQLEGIFAIQKGLTPALAYQFLMNGTRLGIYHWADLNHFTRSGKDNKVNMFKSVATSSVAGAIGAIVGSPFFLVKTHLQSKANESSIAVGHQHNYSRTWPALRSIFKQHGIIGLWRGTSSSIPRVVVASSIQLPTFEKASEFVKEKQIFKKDSIMNPMSASLIAGLFVSFGMAPFDLMSTRFYNQNVDPLTGKGVLYKSLFDCGLKIYSKEGLIGFFKGWTANYLRLGPHTFLCLVFWDQLKYYYEKYVIENK